MAALRSAAGTQVLQQDAVTQFESAADIATDSGAGNEHIIASSTEQACCKAQQLLTRQPFEKPATAPIIPAAARAGSYLMLYGVECQVAAADREQTDQDGREQHHRSRREAARPLLPCSPCAMKATAICQKVARKQ